MLQGKDTFKVGGYVFRFGQRPRGSYLAVCGKLELVVEAESEKELRDVAERAVKEHLAHLYSDMS
jgi:hypothetical protein